MTIIINMANDNNILLLTIIINYNIIVNDDNNILLMTIKISC